MDWLTVYAALLLATTLQGLSLKCGEEIIVQRGEKKVLRFWSSEDEVLNVDVFNKLHKHTGGSLTGGGGGGGLSSSLPSFDEENSLRNEQLEYEDEEDVEYENQNNLYYSYGSRLTTLPPSPSSDGGNNSNNDSDSTGQEGSSQDLEKQNTSSGSTSQQQQHSTNKFVGDKGPSIKTVIDEDSIVYEYIPAEEADKQIDNHYLGDIEYQYNGEETTILPKRQMETPEANILPHLNPQSVDYPQDKPHASSVDSDKKGTIYTTTPKLPQDSMTTTVATPSTEPTTNRPISIDKGGESLLTTLIPQVVRESVKGTLETQTPGALLEVTESLLQDSTDIPATDIPKDLTEELNSESVQTTTESPVSELHGEITETPAYNFRHETEAPTTESIQKSTEQFNELPEIRTEVPSMGPSQDVTKEPSPEVLREATETPTSEDATVPTQTLIEMTLSLSLDNIRDSEVRPEDTTTQAPDIMLRDATEASEAPIDTTVTISQDMVREVTEVPEISKETTITNTALLRDVTEETTTEIFMDATETTSPSKMEDTTLSFTTIRPEVLRHEAEMALNRFRDNLAAHSQITYPPESIMGDAERPISETTMTAIDFTDSTDMTVAAVDSVAEIREATTLPAVESVNESESSKPEDNTIAQTKNSQTAETTTESMFYLNEGIEYTTEIYNTTEVEKMYNTIIVDNTMIDNTGTVDEALIILNKKTTDTATPAPTTTESVDATDSTSQSQNNANAAVKLNTDYLTTQQINLETTTQAIGEGMATQTPGTQQVNTGTVIQRSDIPGTDQGSASHSVDTETTTQDTPTENQGTESQSTATQATNTDTVIQRTGTESLGTDTSQDTSTGISSTGISSTGISSTDISSTDISSTDISSTDISSTDISSTDISSTDISSTDISSTDISSTDISSTDISSTDISSTYISSTDISSTDISGTDISSTGISSAAISSTDISSTDIPSTDISSTDISSTTTQSTTTQTTHMDSQVWTTDAIAIKPPTKPTLPSNTAGDIFQNIIDRLTEALQEDMPVESQEPNNLLNIDINDFVSISVGGGEDILNSENIPSSMLPVEHRKPQKGNASNGPEAGVLKPNTTSIINEAVLTTTTDPMEVLTELPLATIMEVLTETSSIATTTKDSDYEYPELTEEKEFKGYDYYEYLVDSLVAQDRPFLDSSTGAKMTTNDYATETPTTKPSYIYPGLELTSGDYKPSIIDKGGEAILFPANTQNGGNGGENVDQDLPSTTMADEEVISTTPAAPEDEPSTSSSDPNSTTAFSVPLVVLRNQEMLNDLLNNQGGSGNSKIVITEQGSRVSINSATYAADGQSDTTTTAQVQGDTITTFPSVTTTPFISPVPVFIASKKQNTDSLSSRNNAENLDSEGQMNDGISGDPNQGTTEEVTQFPLTTNVPISNTEANIREEVHGSEQYLEETTPSVTQVTNEPDTHTHHQETETFQNDSVHLNADNNKDQGSNSQDAANPNKVGGIGGQDIPTANANHDQTQSNPNGITTQRIAESETMVTTIEPELATLLIPFSFVQYLGQGHRVPSQQGEAGTRLDGEGIKDEPEPLPSYYITNNAGNTAEEPLEENGDSASSSTYISENTEYETLPVSYSPLLSNQGHDNQPNKDNSPVIRGDFSSTYLENSNDQSESNKPEYNVGNPGDDNNNYGIREPAYTADISNYDNENIKYDEKYQEYDDPILGYSEGEPNNEGEVPIYGEVSSDYDETKFEYNEKEPEYEARIEYTEDNSDYENTKLDYSDTNSEYDDARLVYSEDNAENGDVNFEYSEGDSEYDTDNTGYSENNSAYENTNIGGDESGPEYVEGQPIISGGQVGQVMSRKDDTGQNEYGGDSPFFIKLPGSPNAVPVFLQYEPVQIKYVSSDQSQPESKLDVTASSPDSRSSSSHGQTGTPDRAIKVEYTVPETPDQSGDQQQEVRTAEPTQTDGSLANSLMNGIYRILNGESMAANIYQADGQQGSTQFTFHKPIVERPDPFFLMEPPQLGSQIPSQTPQSPGEGGNVQEPSYGYKVQLSSKLGVADQPRTGSASSKGTVEDVPLGTKDDILYPGDYYKHDSFTGVNPIALVNPVFELNTRATTQSEDERMNPQYTPFPITANPPRTTPSTQENYLPHITHDPLTASTIISNTPPSSSSATEAPTPKTPHSVEFSPIPAANFEDSYDSDYIPEYFYDNENAIVAPLPSSPEVIEALTLPIANGRLGGVLQETRQVSAAPFIISDEAVPQEVPVTDDKPDPSTDVAAHQQVWSSPESRVLPGATNEPRYRVVEDRPDDRVYTAFYSPREIPGIFRYRKVQEDYGSEINSAALTAPQYHPTIAVSAPYVAAAPYPYPTHHAGGGGPIQPQNGHADQHVLGPQFFKYLNSMPYAMLHKFLDPTPSPPLARRKRSELTDKGAHIFCEWNIKTDPGLYLLMTFHNLSAAYTVDCHGAYIEVERENNGYDARWCGNRASQAGSRPHVIFAKTEVRITVYDDGDTTKDLPTGFEADIEVIDLFDARDYTDFMRSNAYPHIRRLLDG